jgi:hypothetical protein
LVNNTLSSKANKFTAQISNNWTLATVPIGANLEGVEMTINKIWKDQTVMTNTKYQIQFSVDNYIEIEYTVNGSQWLIIQDASNQWDVYLSGVWLTPPTITLPTPPTGDWIVRSIDTGMSSDPNAQTVLTWNSPAPVVMDLEQVYDIAVSGGGGGVVIDTHWETNTSNQLVPSSNNPVVLPSTLTVNDSILTTNGSITAGGDISCSQSLSVGTDANIQGGLVTNKKISCGSSDIDSIYSKGSISIDGGIYLSACNHSWDDAGFNLQDQGLYCGGISVNGALDSRIQGAVDFYGDLNLSNCAININDQWGSRTITSQPGSHTITHFTNIIDYDISRLGCFCETFGILADVYDKDGMPYVPTLDRPCDAICKVKPSSTLNNRILGIIVGPNTFANLGDCLCVVKLGPRYEVGDLLAPDISGVCRRATDDEKIIIMLNGLPRVRITGILPNDCQFVLAFIQ